MKPIRAAVLLAFIAAAPAAQAQTTLSISQLQASTKCSDALIFITDTGREGMFVPVPGSTAVANNGTTLSCNANGGAGRVVYKRVYDSTINAKWFGLSETAADNSVAVQNAIDSAKKGQEVLIPEGSYTFQNSITLPDNQYIRLTARGELTFNAAEGIVVIGRFGHVLDLTRLHNHAWEDTPRYGYTGTAIKLVNAVNATVKVNWIDGFKTAIMLTGEGHNGSQYNKINFDLLTHNDIGLQLTTESDGQLNWVNENTFTGGRISGLTGLSAVPGAGQTDPFNGNKFYNIGFEGATTGVDVDKFSWNIFIAPRLFSAEGVVNGFKFSPSSQDNAIVTTGLYENAFVSNGVAANAGVRTLVLGRLLTSDGVTSGVLNIADDNGRFLGLKRDTPVPSKSKSRVLPLSTLTGVSP
ncbi:hypothetical protein GTP58_08440 [Duganella sp. CY15W]|uniref:glycosyl hydrolase family 28-related protein n=1 Tax=Duganella sp. CY15W TaxID=2692172 RepID=UPI00136877D0|nr:glycosyl hydrolase family 28-related protein [Duganella sp. CY15W]MYM28350.1 hypothetical protein [Duganella sp. CY15W]